MEAVKISPKYQVVIPKHIRNSMRLKPGQRMQVVEFGNRIELIPISPIANLRGSAKGIDVSLVREDDRI
jgi:AbrB family looped-hinge helix DNA binding protein